MQKPTGVASSSSSTTAVQTAAPQITNASSSSSTAVQPAVSQVDATVASSSSTSTLSTAVQPAGPPVGSSAASSAASSSSSSTSSATVALAAPIIEKAGTTDREVASATAVPADAPKRTAAMSAKEGGDVDEDEFEAVPKRRRRRGGRS
ncbi:hypothetical protein H9P43_005854 [Blastocladiella emersonii ATCC 22665]|nr:hypothetical protein H9P43_005854 [Blastocladiella emersonii ATCC 22665]